MLWALVASSLPVVASPEICVLAPFLERSNTNADGIPKALVPLSRPTLFIREPLEEIRMEEGGRLLWNQQTGKGGPSLEGPLPWPLAPLQAGQGVTVRLRPMGVGGEHFATIEVQGASRPRLQQGDGLLHSLEGRPRAWKPAVEALLSQGDQALAIGLLFAVEGPNEPDLNALRRLVAQESCH